MTTGSSATSAPRRSSPCRAKYRRAGDKAVRQVDWRHLIGTLVKKPQAFRHSVFREDLFPRAVFRRAWEALDQKLVKLGASVERIRE